MIRVVTDLVFPKLCLACKETCQKRYFCDSCWELSQLLEPDERCIHCFRERESGRSLCNRCLRAPLFPFQRGALFDRAAPICRLLNLEEFRESFASYALIQWKKMGWERPDFIVPVPSKEMGIAKLFAELLDVPCFPLLRRRGWPLGSEEWIMKEKMIEEESVILLFDTGCSCEMLKMGINLLLEAFPKNLYILSLWV